MHPRDTKFKPDTKIIQYGFMAFFVIIATMLDKLFGTKYDKNGKVIK